MVGVGRVVGDRVDQPDGVRLGPDHYSLEEKEVICIVYIQEYYKVKINVSIWIVQKICTVLQHNMDQ